MKSRYSRLLSLIVLLSIFLPAAWGIAPDLSGHWVLSTVTPTGEGAVLIVKFENQGDGPKATGVYQRPVTKGMQTKPEISEFQSDGHSISFAVKQGKASKKLFTGLISKDGKSVLGSFGADPRPLRAKLLPTDKVKLEAGDVYVRRSAEAYSKAADLQSKAMLLSFQAQNEKDAEKKKALAEKLKEAKKEADSHLPELWRAAVEAHQGEPAAYDASLAVLRGGSRYKVTAAEAQKLADSLENQAAPYGARFRRSTLQQIAELLANDKPLAKVGAAAAGKLAKEITEKDPADYQAQVLGLWKTALINAGETQEIEAIKSRIAKLDEKQDAEYAKNIPPFKPEAYKGRQDKEANRVAVLELFTGAQCPPCVAADIAFDALEHAYTSKDLILIQYHLHVPGPDPLTNAASESRMEYYKKLHPEKVRGATPTTLFNGSPKAGGGGFLADSETKYGKYREVINPILETKTPIALTGKATRKANKIRAAVQVQGADMKEELVVRFVVVEEKIKYVGGNKLRFHHQVVRAIPQSVGPLAGNPTSHSMELDLTSLHQELTEYLDGFARRRPFSNPSRPLDFQGLKVVALVQNDKTGEIVQAAQFDLKD